MKIGILTYHWVFNFGANLQTLSTIGYLRRIGHDPVVINWIPEDSEQLYYESTKKEQIDVFLEFQKNYYPLTRLCRSSKDVADVIKEEQIEMVFEGADTLFMLWKPFFDKRIGKVRQPYSDMTFPNPFWGEYLNYCSVPVVGFSIATLQTEAKDFPDIADEAGRYLRRFSKLTVRDIPTQNLVKSFTNGEMIPKITPDPVFAFNENVTLDEESILKEFGVNKEYYLICIPEPYNKRLRKWVSKLDFIFQQHGKSLYELPRQTGNRCFDIKQLNRIIISPLEWYVLIKNCSGYVGGLMHPIVTCIHNQVPFYSVDYYGLNYPLPVLNHFTRIKTSKTYQIIKDCGLTKYYGHIRGILNRVPSPIKVYRFLMNYDKDSLKKASEMKKNQLLEALDYILDI